MLQTVRVVFSKEGRARFISHLDLTRTMTRVMRRTGIPIWYTEGFNRHPYLTFAAPLSLGYEGQHETMDLRLEADIAMEELVDRINAAMPEGLRAVSAAPAVCKPADLAWGDYRLTFDAPQGAIKDLLEQPEILVEKRTKKKAVKVLDIRPFFAACVLTADGEKTHMDVVLPCGSEQNVNPSLFLQALSQKNGREYHCRVLRRELMTANKTLFR